ncbi:MAG: hypothetical protein JWP44_2425 [Mucilaginibacter sp.]|nr:hypothetical protein [Mucilaginibacter sp.]
MENVKPSASKVAFKWAIINFIASVVITYAFQFLNVDQTSSVKYLSFIPFIAFLFLTQKEYRDQLGGFISFGEGFVSGLLFSVFTGILGAIFIYIYYQYLSPQVYEQILSSTQAQLQAKGSLSADQIDKAMSVSRKYGPLFAAIGAVIFSPIIGAIIALIGAAIFKKERSLLDIESTESYSDPAV